MNIREIEVELVSNCNLRCPLCIRNSEAFKNDKLKNVILNPEILYKLLETNDIKTVVLAGSISEPTLHPDFLKIISKLLKYNIEIIIYTNGTAKLELYKKLSILLKANNNSTSIIFTVCGTTQELHEKYRVGSNLEDILNAYDECIKYSYTELNWIIFNYNIEDFKKNSNFFGERNIRVFHSIAYNEILEGEYKTKISIDDKTWEKIKKIDKKWDLNCSADNLKFRTLTCDGKIYKCNMQRFYGEKYCFICNKNNLNTLLENGITPPPEPSGEVYIFENIKKKK